MSDGREPGADELELVAQLVGSMAHQLRNPMQAIAVNLEVVRTKVSREAPELWEDLERFASAADQNVRLLNRRLELLVAAGRRRPGEDAATLDPVRLARDLAAAVRFDREPPRVRVEAGEGMTDAGVRTPPGALVALVFAMLRAARSAASGEEVVLRASSAGDGAEVVLEVALPPAGAGAAGSDWERLAAAAGGRAESVGEGAGRRLRVLLPHA
ncbi:MAG TPA: histidine kinase dimerization/phospho-acceptor domain-containing protein [Gemmatimonadota bacterium]|nr:histidine kinase dimerization/phospho-acceptor domain-containing protein [Gemmatimonadota bacterium]